MEELKNQNESAYNWLAAKPPTEWTKAHFKEGVKCDMLLNNICESFNQAIMDARDKPIITLLESIRFWLMCRFCKRRESVLRWTETVHNNIVKIVRQRQNVSRHCSVTRANATMFEVRMNIGGAFTVDLDKRTCTCRIFQLSGIPCGHALAAIWFCNHHQWGYIHDYYQKPAFQAAYEGTIFPMSSPDQWPNKGHNPILPPGDHNLPGRPRKKRKRAGDEPPPPTATKTRRFGLVMHCSNCREAGHTKAKCKKPKTTTPQTQVEKTKGGRPPSKNPSEETLKRRKRKEKQLARETRDNAPAAPNARSSNPTT
ncbi:hypothetical protein CsatB_020193 [Cannabis sativa]